MLVVASVIFLLDLLFSRHTIYPPLDSISDAKHLHGIERVYVTSNQWNSADQLEQHWIPSLIQLIKGLRSANISVYISIYENGSWDSTKSVLKQLKQTLADMAVESQVIIDDTSHEQIISQNTSSSGWLQTSYGTSIRRIPYLANVRNEALKPLSQLTSAGVKFDKIVYINDVVFSVRLSSADIPNLSKI